MTTRRDFIRRAGAAAGMAFCSCAMLDAARAQQPAAAARVPVTVGGKRIKTIDVHSHCLFHEAVDLLGADARNVVQSVRGFEKQYIVVEGRLKAMDAQGIDMEVLRYRPFDRRRPAAARIGIPAACSAVPVVRAPDVTRKELADFVGQKVG